MAVKVFTALRDSVDIDLDRYFEKQEEATRAYEEIVENHKDDIKEIYKKYNKLKKEIKKALDSDFEYFPDEVDDFAVELEDLILEIEHDLEYESLYDTTWQEVFEDALEKENGNKVGHFINTMEKLRG